MLTVYCTTRQEGSVELQPTMIGGLMIRTRIYPVQHGIVVLDGYPDVVLHHDAALLLENASYRMPTPAELSAFEAAKRLDQTIEE